MWLSPNLRIRKLRFDHTLWLLSKLKIHRLQDQSQNSGSIVFKKSLFLIETLERDILQFLESKGSNTKCFNEMGGALISVHED